MQTGTPMGCAALPEKEPTHGASGPQAAAGPGAAGWAGGLPPPFAVSGAGIHMILLFFKFAVEVVHAATHPLAALASSHCAVSKHRGFPAQRPRGRIQNWAKKEAELKINVSAS